MGREAVSAQTEGAKIQKQIKAKVAPFQKQVLAVVKEAKAQAEAKQREKAAIIRLFSQGLATEEIATAFDLPVAEVAATIAEAQKEQAEQAEQN